MLFEEKLKELRTQQQLPQLKLAAVLDIDTAICYKIEKGGRKAKREQVVILSELLNVKDDTLLTLWSADSVTSVVSNNHSIVQGSLSIAASTIQPNDNNG